MPSVQNHPFQNRLLQAMSEEDLSSLRPHLEAVELTLRQHLNEANEPREFAYFLDSGVCSILLGPERTTGVEVAIVGREGFVGTSIVLGVGQSPHHEFIQLPGAGWRIRAEHLEAAVAASGTLQALLLKYVHVAMTQKASTAFANADYTVEERLARWLLMSHDRVDGDDIFITHEFMALMLGVRRPGVTVATHMLEGEGMIRAKRGHIAVVDRAKLIEKANGCYGLAEAEYERVIGPLRRNGQESNLINFPARAGL